MAKSAKLKTDSQRYREFGGLASVIGRYRSGELSLAAIAEAVGVSRETVRKDIKNALGAREFERLRERRKESRRRKRDVWMNLSTARERLAQMTQSADKATASELRVLSEVVAEMDKAGASLSVLISYKGAVKFALSDGRCVSVRVAVIDGSLKEHQIGFHRFKITPSVSQCPFAVFALGVEGETLPFVFKSSEIEHVRSLNLRFSNTSKYAWVKRRSKYDHALGNWKALRSH